MKANEKQVGGLHYKSEYEHWDLVLTIPLDYLEGCCTKYVSRARKKNRLQDLHKAMHYLEKLMEVAEFNLRRNLREPEIHAEVNRYALANDLTMLEEEFMVSMCLYENNADLQNTRCILEEIILETEVELRRDIEANYPGTPEDGGHHAL